MERVTPFLKPFFYVLVRDGLSRVIDEARCEEIQALEADGWKAVFDSVRSIEDGWEYAARLHQAVPDGYEDHMAPRRMDGPRTLYRSVSPAEFDDIVLRGEIYGRLNLFNDFDRRRLVMFGDQLNEQLIHQGEELERQGVVALKEAWANSADADIRSRREDAAKAFRRTFEPLFAKRVAQHQRAGSRPPEPQDRLLGDVDRGHASIALRLERMVGPDRNLAAIAAEMRSIEQEFELAQKRFREELSVWIRERKEALAGAEATSFVIETRPLQHGFHYSDSFGRSGMGGDDEFGFISGSVTTDDVVQVHVVLRGEVVDVLSLEDANSRYRLGERGYVVAA